MGHAVTGGHAGTTSLALLALALGGCASATPESVSDSHQPSVAPAPDQSATPSQAPEQPTESAAPPEPAFAALNLPAIDLEAGARALHEAAIVVDLHMDTLWKIHKDGGRFRSRSPARQFDLPRMVSGGVDGQVFAIWMPPDSHDPQELARELVALFEYEMLDSTPELELARTAEDVLRLHGEGKRAAILGLEGAVALDGDLDFMRFMHARGVRYAALTWNESNPFGDGAKGTRNGGATPLGLELVKLLNELRVIVDVSHASEETFWDVITTSARPVIASHSNAAAICDHARNLDDLQLWAIADSGGVVGLNLHSRFLICRRGSAKMKDVLAHAAHIREVVGAQHMALGSDFDGSISPPKTLKDAGALPRLTQALLDQAFTAREVVLVVGHAFLRVFHETSAGSAERRVVFRPIESASVDVSSNPKSASHATDRDTQTAWKPVSRETSPWLRLEVSGAGISRVTIAAVGAGDGHEPCQVRVTVKARSGGHKHSSEVGVASAHRPTRVLLPEALACGGAATVEVTPVDPGAACPGWGLTEVVAERDVRVVCGGP